MAPKKGTATRHQSQRLASENSTEGAPEVGMTQPLVQVPQSETQQGPTPSQTTPQEQPTTIVNVNDDEIMKTKAHILLTLI